MLSSLLCPQKGRRGLDPSTISLVRNAEEAPLPQSQYGTLQEHRRLAADRERTQGGFEERSEDDNGDVSAFDEDNEQDVGDEEEDEDGELDTRRLLPIFSADHLGIPLSTQALAFLIHCSYPQDAIPVYDLTHTIRLLVVARCETTLSWDQLRSPQVSRFLVKPLQQQIRFSYLSKATPYALMANCLQFNKEVATNPGNSGTSRTRALFCELLAIKLLREFTTRELVG